MRVSKKKTNLYFAEVFFTSIKGNPCSYSLYMNAKDEEEAFDKSVEKVEKLNYFSKMNEVNIIKMQSAISCLPTSAKPYKTFKYFLRTTEALGKTWISK